MCEPPSNFQPVYCRHTYASESKHAKIYLLKSGQSAAYGGPEMGYTPNMATEIPLKKRNESWTW